MAALMGNPLAPSLDALGLALPGMVAIVRVGCFLGGCCYGRPSSCGVRYRRRTLKPRAGCQKYSPGSPPSTRVLPVQLLESLGNVAVLVILLLLAPAFAGSGRLFGAYAVCYGALRFLLDFWRVSSALRPVGKLSMGQVFAAGMIVAGSMVLLIA
jgi:phosphatidylglycerol:prolipoprotein diacylglycerol transferase